VSTQDEVTLSTRERQQIARMQASLQAADPELAKVLRREKLPKRDPVGSAWRQGGRRLIGDTAGLWLGPLAVVGGLALMVVTVASLVWVSVLAALVTTAGLGLWGAAVQRRLARNAPKRPVRRTEPD
jgi:Protein of unknown function (DUF3040)